MKISTLLGIVLWSLIPGFIAKKKRRSFWGYYFLGFIITPLFAAIVTLLLSSKADEAEVEDSPYSYEEIQTLIPGAVKDHCQKLAGDNESLQRYLKECANQRLIQPHYVKPLLQEFAPAKERVKPEFAEIQHLIPQGIKDRCRELSGDRERLKQYLTECAETKLIQPHHLHVILEEFTDKAETEDAHPQISYEKNETVALVNENAAFRNNVENERALATDKTQEMINCPVCNRRQSATHTKCAVCGADIHLKSSAPQQDSTKTENKIILTNTNELTQRLQEAINDNYPGMMMFVRDVNLSPILASKYKPGMIIRERSYVDASARVEGMITTHRFAILSNHMSDFSSHEQNTNWRLFVAGRDSRFKVLGSHTYQGKTAIFLLHLPDNNNWKLFQNKTLDLDQQLLDDCIKRFETKCLLDPIPELTTDEWLRRCATPVGMDERGYFWGLE